MEIINLHEKEDGGCEIEFDLTKEETQALLGYALRELLTKLAMEAVDEGSK